MKDQKLKMTVVSLISAFIVAGCAGNSEDTPAAEETNQSEHTEMNHSDMDHSSSGEVPEGLKAAETPTYEVGNKVIIEEGHMEGMEGAEAMVTGAYDTIAYVISYTPTTGGERVTDHKWVIHEEILEAKEEEALSRGTEVTIDAAHMEGMDGATAEIESAEQTTVYMIDFSPTTGGKKVTNHKWVTESELSSTEGE